MKDIEKDKQAIENLIENKTICWGEVSRLAHNGDERYMMLTLPAMFQNGISGGEHCIIFSDDADADNVNPYLLNLMGRTIPFLITAIDEENDRLICSRKNAQLELKAAMLQGLQNGNVYEGTLTGFGRFGAYVEVNGVTGHIRNSDFTSDHSEVREYLSQGDHLEVRCKEITQDGYIFWESVAKVHRTKPIEHDFEADTIVLGKIVRISDFQRGIGVFVNLKQGIDALCSVPQDIEVEEGARVSVKIESVVPNRDLTKPPRIRGRIISVC